MFVIFDENNYIKDFFSFEVEGSEEFLDFPIEIDDRKKRNYCFKDVDNEIKFDNQKWEDYLLSLEPSETDVIRSQIRELENEITQLDYVFIRYREEELLGVEHYKDLSYVLDTLNIKEEKRLIIRGLEDTYDRLMEEKVI